MDSPYGKNSQLNIYRPSVLRQYFGKDVSKTETSSTMRYTYGNGSGCSTLGIDPSRFMTRPFTSDMYVLSDLIHQFLLKNKATLGLDNVYLGDGFNHCTVLLYYAGEGLRKESFLRPHCDCTYSVHNGNFMQNLNSQVENTPTVFYSLGTTRELRFDRRKIEIGKRGNKWCTDKLWTNSYWLSSDTISIIHPDDENPKKSIPISENYQYRHGVSKVTGDEFTLGIGLRIVSSIQEYDIKSNIRCHTRSDNDQDYSKEYKRFMTHRRHVHKKLLQKFHSKVDKLI